MPTPWRRTVGKWARRPPRHLSRDGTLVESRPQVTAAGHRWNGGASVLEGPVPQPDRYKWIALSNASLGSFMAALDSSIVIIAIPGIFRGIGLDPLAPGNIGYLLWLILGDLLVMAVLVVSVGRLGDMFGRVRIY